MKKFEMKTAMLEVASLRIPKCLASIETWVAEKLDQTYQGIKIRIRTEYPVKNSVETELKQWLVDMTLGKVEFVDVKPFVFSVNAILDSGYLLLAKESDDKKANIITIYNQIAVITEK